MSEPGGTEGTRPARERAEEMVELLGQRMGLIGSQVGRRILRLAARAREEAEDMWAEAQNLHRGSRGQP